MSLSLVLDGEPAGCRVAAAKLRALAQALHEGGDVVGALRGRSDGAWVGSAGDQFRTNCADLVDRSDSAELAVLMIARSLDDLGEALSAVRSELDRAAAIARAAGIPVAQRLPTFDELSPTPEQEPALDHACAVVLRARDDETAAHQAHDAALQEAVSLLPSTRPARRLGSRKESLLDRVLPDLPAIPDLPRPRLPDLPGLDDLPALPPIPVPPGLPLPSPGTPPSLRLLRDLANGAREQYARDADRDDLSLVERLLRSTLSGSGEAGGAAAGIALCVRARVPAALLLACGEGGRRVGRWGARQGLELLDAH